METFISIFFYKSEKRAFEGYPALAVQWGAVGDVGLVADMQEENKEIVIGGTLQQKILSCLQELDNFLQHNYTIVSSMVVAEKRAGGAGAINMVDTVLNIMGSYLNITIKKFVILFFNINILK